MNNKVSINLEYLKEQLYLIIPMICICLMAFLVLIHENFNLYKGDFIIIYNSGKRLLENPEELYHPQKGFYYFPSFAIALALTVSLFPLSFAVYIFYINTIILGILFVREYNKILILMKLDDKIQRFIFLLLVSNSFLVYYQFFNHNWKFIMGTIFLYVLRREMQWNHQKRNKDLKFYLCNYALLVFAVGVFPYFSLFLILYVFHDIEIKDILKRNNIQKYCIFIIVFAIENFLIFIYPSYIIDISELFVRHNKTRNFFPLFYLRDFDSISLDFMNMLILTSTILLIIFIMIMSFSRNLKLVEKIAWVSFFCIFGSTFARRTLVFLFPLAILLFVPFIDKGEKGINGIKKDKILLIGILSSFIFTFMFPSETIFKYFPYFENTIFGIFIFLRWIFLLSIFGGSILILNLRNNTSENNEINNLPIDYS